ncbi:uncharacterized protein LOC135479531 [Liolophura sinensis]|uniref:uncharacterized protein LOC135479531 n=1 Tax=Liolophura sinensis TaxID=3198878 RepID=UPI003158216B
MLSWFRSLFSTAENATFAASNDHSGEKNDHTKEAKTLSDGNVDNLAGKDVILVRPRDPSTQWLPDDMCSAAYEETECHHGNDLLALNTYFINLEMKNEDCGLQDVNKRIFSDISTMIGQAFQQLHVKYQAFRGAVVHKVGSAGEGTKVGAYNEFDFMVELSALEDPLLEQAVPMLQTTDPYGVVNVRDVNFPLNFVPQANVTFYDSGRPDMFGTLKTLVGEELFSSLLPNWSPGSNFKIGSSQDKGKVRTIRLRYVPEDNQSPMNVFCDFSFCIPFEWTPERRFLLRRCGTKTDLMTDQQRFRVLIRSSKLWMVTTALREKDKLINSLTSANAKRVYKLAKIVVQNLLPPIYDFDLDTFEGIIPSYWLKQIILFMMDQYPKQASWREDFLGPRVSQMIAILHKCLQKNMLCNYCSPMQNHTRDNSKTDESNMAKKYLPLLAELLKRATNGDSPALKSLIPIKNLNFDFKLAIATKAKMMRLLFLLLRYKGLVWKDRYLLEYTKFFSRMTQAESLLTVIKDYVKFHLADTTYVYGFGRAVRIWHKGEENSLDEFITKLRDDPHLFPDDWERLYDKMLEAYVPDDVINVASFIMFPLGHVIRKTFGKTRQPPTMGEEYFLTHEFLMV